jgi:hypothetical protein
MAVTASKKLLTSPVSKLPPGPAVESLASLVEVEALLAGRDLVHKLHTDSHRHKKHG